MNTTYAGAIVALESLIEQGAFASRLEEYLNRTFRESDREGWYPETLAADGFAAAEEKLASWVKNSHSDVFSSVAEPVARGILALAKAQEDSLVEITDCKSDLHDEIRSEYGPRYKFITTNVSAPGCGCMQPQGSYVWGPYGEIGLRAAILETGHTYAGPKSSLTLVLPTWSCNESTAAPKGAVAFAKFETTGYESGEQFRPFARLGDSTEWTTNADATMKHVLGMDRLADTAGVQMMMSDISKVLGFPGAESYLAAQLPSLGGYFEALAEKLSTPHRH